VAKKKRTVKAGPIEAGEPAQKEVGAELRPSASLARTALLFVGFMGLFHVVLWLALPEWKDNFQVQDFLARIVAGILNNLGVSGLAQGNQVILTSNTLIVTQECTGENVLILFSSFLLAYPSSLKAKCIGLAAGIPFLCIVNVARIVATGLMSEYFPRRYMELFHDYVWQMAFLFLVVTMWFVWIDMVVKREKTPAVSC
jgi:exosortase/archaeosortase family protein